MSQPRERESEEVYRRPLPGGGFVAIEVTPTRNILGRTRYRGEIVVERRSRLDRRVGHEAPVIAELSAASLNSVFDDLFPTALSNVSIAAICLKRQKELTR
jgi:hypothetical protein